MSFKVFLLAILVASFVSLGSEAHFHVIGPSLPDFLNPCKQITLSGEPATLACIVLSLCRDHSPARVKGFADCYDQNGALGKEQFFGCMAQGFGNRYLNTTENAHWACWHFPTLIPYATCLTPAFEKAGVDGKLAVKNVNICQGKALGLGKRKV